MEHVLTRGNVGAAVMRVGDTVRKPVTPATPAVEALLSAALPDLLRTATGEPWTRLYAEGHADHWGPAADYVGRHLDVWRTALG